MQRPSLALSMQVVYLLDVACHTVSPFLNFSGKAEESYLRDIRFTLDSSMILSVFEHWDGALLEVHSRHGEGLRQVHCAYYSMHMACLPMDRVAVTSGSCGFSVLDLLTGQQTAAVKLHEQGLNMYDEDLEPDRHSLICTDKNGARLAYAEPDITVHLFDAVTLQSLGSFWPPAGTVPGNSGFYGLHLGMHSCSFHTFSDMRMGSSHLCRLETGMSVLGKLLSARVLAVSEDDAFVASGFCRDGQIMLQMFDVCSGALVLTHDTGLPGNDDVWAPMGLTWIGCCLLVTVNGLKDESSKYTDHIIFLQF